MPKYYIKDGMEEVIQAADTPEYACALAVLHKFATFIVNGVYIVSEKGFDCEDDETIMRINSNEVVNIIYNIFLSRLDDNDND
tara:strand:- start:343 stop:591 length:249 start_codon:yes stop_codon:yes gene_type:complete